MKLRLQEVYELKAVVELVPVRNETGKHLSEFRMINMFNEDLAFDAFRQSKVMAELIPVAKHTGKRQGLRPHGRKIFEPGSLCAECKLRRRL